MLHALKAETGLVFPLFQIARILLFHMLFIRKGKGSIVWHHLASHVENKPN